MGTTDPQPFTLVSRGESELVDLLDVVDDRFQIKKIFEGEGIRMIRLAFRAGQVMREHSTNSPLVVQMLAGTLDFRIAGETLKLEPGSVLYVTPHEMHELEADTDAHVLLTLGLPGRPQPVQLSDTPPVSSKGE